jgi:zinc transport system substrate-binding protein
MHPLFRLAKGGSFRFAGALGSAIDKIVTQTFLSAVSQAFQHAGVKTLSHPADRNVGDTADKNVCVTLTLVFNELRQLCRWPRALGVLMLLFSALSQMLGSEKEKPLTILCSFYPIYVMTLNVVGDTQGVKVECLASPTIGCLHDYQLTPADLKLVQRADIFVANGAGMESFIGKALQQAPHLQVIEASRGMELAFNDNPHVWVSVSGAMGETTNIMKGLAMVDPAHASAYNQNATGYEKRLAQLRAEMHAALDGLTNREIITFHEAFPYFAREFNLKTVGVVEREPGSEPSARELAKTIQLVRQTKVQALFAEPQYPARSADVIHRETGVPVSVLDPAVTGPRDPGEARDSYIHTMQANLKVLVNALRG